MAKTTSEIFIIDAACPGVAGLEPCLVEFPWGGVEVAMPRAVIFDVDGTLVDSVDFHALAWQEAFEAFGHQVEFQEIRRQIGKGGDQLLPVFLSAQEIAKIGHKLETHRAAVLKEKYLPRIQAFPKVPALLKHLLEAGLKIALASSAKEDELAVYKKAAGIESLIDTETSSDDAEKSKPHPDIFEAALARLGPLPLKDVLVVGDTPYDAEAAAKAGLKTIGLRCGGWADAELMDAGCVAVYQDPADLLACYGKSPLRG